MKGTYNGILALSLALWHKKDKKELLMVFLKQAVFCSVLIIAFTPIIKIEGSSYTVFLLSGLASWFYLEEIMATAPGLDAQYSVLLRSKGYHPVYLTLAQALSALPILFFWTMISVFAALITNTPINLFYMLPIYFICNTLCAMAYGSLSQALSPVLPGAADAGLSITLPVLFWTTPLVWPASILPNTIYKLSYLNPLFYLTEMLRGVTITGRLPGGLHTGMFFAALYVTWAFGLFLLFRVQKTALSMR